MKLPTWKAYFADHPELRDAVEQHFVVRRILKPSRYPSWGFLTDEFRLSVEMPEGFEKALRSHGASKTAVIFTVVVEKGRPKVGCRIYSDRDAGIVLPWKIIACFDTWFALDDEEAMRKQGSDGVDSIALEPTVDAASINNFVATQRSTGRHKGSTRSRKTGSA